MNYGQSSKAARRQLELAALAALELNSRREARDRLPKRYQNFYEWQREFCKETARHHEACLCAANQIGKTLMGTAIDAFHLTGDYPDDYPGHKFDRAPTIWLLGYSMEKTRDLLQTELFGAYQQKKGFAGGLIPADRIDSWESAQGTVNAMRTVNVKHRSGDISTVQFWSYSQGQHALMGDVVDWFHIDEEPRDPAIRPQVLTRTINGDQGRGGRGIYTFTPENGRTDLVIQFMDSPSPDQFFMMKGWDDAPHMTPQKRERLLEQYPAYQRDMRSKGVPMLGHGRIFDIGDNYITCAPFEIPDHFKVIGGMDFGWDHPQAFAKLAIDMDSDTIYVTNTWKRSKTSANDAWGATRGWLENIPVAWPSDGLQHEKGAKVATQTKSHYANAGFTMLREHAQWPDGGVSVEAGIYEMNDRFTKGTLKIFAGQADCLEEIRQYHRDDNGKIVKIRDDILSAIRYAYMMRRFAKAKGDIGVQQPIVRPKPRRVYDRRTQQGQR